LPPNATRPAPGRQTDEDFWSPRRAPPEPGSHTASAPRGIRTPDHQIRSLVLGVDLVGTRRIWPAHVECLVDLVGSRQIPSDRLDDQPDDQVPSAESRRQGGQ
jgi:hypothetical protein